MAEDKVVKHDTTEVIPHHVDKATLARRNKWKQTDATLAKKLQDNWASKCRPIM